LGARPHDAGRRPRYAFTDLRAFAVARSRGARLDEERAHWLAVATDFGRWLEHRALPNLTAPLPAPPDPFGLGDPIVGWAW
jgi:hypothetical protein